MEKYVPNIYSCQNQKWSKYVLYLSLIVGLSDTLEIILSENSSLK